VQKIGGGAPVRITHDPAFGGHPVWSSDGARIAFAQADEEGATALR
jgi:Tol biopolymer transport system component